MADSAKHEFDLPEAERTVPLRVFLCHSSGDKPAVRELYRRLCAEGVDVWLDEEKLLPGQEWQREIPKAVRSSDVVIVCLSSRSINTAGYVQKEITFALDVADEQPEGAIFLIPARLEECSVPDRLSRWQWVNLFEERGYERLMQALQARAGELGKSISPAQEIGEESSPRAALPAAKSVADVAGPTWSVGDRVFVYWSPDEHWYPATIRSLDGERVYIRFDDGTKQWTTGERVAGIDLEIGDQVGCRWKGGRYYYPAHVDQLEGERLGVEYEYVSEGAPVADVDRVDRASEQQRLGKLRRLFAEYFSEGELRDICFDLGADYEDLAGEGKADKARELILHFARRGQLYKLTEMGKRLRPNVDWEFADPEPEKDLATLALDPTFGEKEWTTLSMIRVTR